MPRQLLLSSLTHTTSSRDSSTSIHTHSIMMHQKQLHHHSPRYRHHPFPPSPLPQTIKHQPSINQIHTSRGPRPKSPSCSRNQRPAQRRHRHHHTHITTITTLRHSLVPSCLLSSLGWVCPRGRYQRGCTRHLRHWPQLTSLVLRFPQHSRSRSRRHGRLQRVPSKCVCMLRSKIDSLQRRNLENQGTV